MKNERGITLVALIITIIVTLLLVGTAVSVGTTTYKTAQREAFISEMKIIQAKVDEAISQERVDEITENNTTTINTEQQNILNTAYGNQEITTAIYDGTKCKYFSKQDLKTYFDLENMEDDVIINFETREVISMIGIEYLGIMHYTQYKLPGGQVITNNETQTNRTIEPLTITKVMNGLNATVTISNISITNATLSYKEKEDTYWNTITNYTTKEKNETVIISKSGTFEFKIVDNTNGSNTNYDETNSVYSEIVIKTTNSPKENATSISIDKTEGNINPYDYAVCNFAEGTAISDSSQYIWIPRFAYKESDSTLKYTKGTTNIATDNTYLGTDYTIPPVFTNAEGTKLTGIWLQIPAIGLTSDSDLVREIKYKPSQAIDIIIAE